MTEVPFVVEDGWTSSLRRAISWVLASVRIIGSSSCLLKAQPARL